MPVIFFLTKQSPILLQVRALTLEHKKIKIFKLRTIKSSPSFSGLEMKSGKILDKHEYAKFVPPFCRWLRISGIDEIPQLVNVLMGDMSIIGPRPLAAADLLMMKEKDPEIYERRKNIFSKPGITGYWQIFGNRLYGTKNLIEHDEFYEKNKSISLEVKILFLTAFIILSAKHSDSIISSGKNDSDLVIPERQVCYLFYKME